MFQIAVQGTVSRKCSWVQKRIYIKQNVLICEYRLNKIAEMLYTKLKL